MAWYLDHIKLAAMGSKSVEEFLTGRGVAEDVVSYITTITDQRLRQQMVGYLAKNPRTTFEMLQQQFNRQPQNVPIIPPKPQHMDTRFRGPREKEEFFSRVPKEYVQWVTKILNDIRFDFIPEEDYYRLAAALDSFTQLKTRNDIPLEKDINKYRTLNDLENAIAPYEGTGSKNGGYLQYNPLRLPGVELVNKYPSGLILYKISDPDSLAKMGNGTKWCTREDYGRGNYSARYIKQFGFLYICVQNNKPIIQMTPDLSQLMDVNDKTTSLPRELYGVLGDEYARKLNVSPQLLKEFSTEEASNNVELILKKVKDTPSVISLASDKLQQDPVFILKASKINPDCSKYASDELLENDEFSRTLERLTGNYDYSHVYNSEDLEEAIYGEMDYGIGNLLGNWDINYAYEQLMNKFSRNRHGERSGDSDACGEVLGNAAVDSDIERLKAGEFGIKNIKKIALSLARSERKHPTLDYSKMYNQERLNELVSPYIELAKKRTSRNKEGWDPATRTYTNTPLSEVDYMEKVRKEAFNIMQHDVKYTGIKKIEELAPEAQREFIARAIDDVSQIGNAYNKRQESFEKYDFDDYYIEYPDEPEESDYESPEEYQNALSEWETERDSIRDDHEQEYFRNNLPYCFDQAIIDKIEEQVVKTKFRFPAWIHEFFAKGNKPAALYGIEQANKKALENKKKYAPKKKTLRRASGWYSLAKQAYEEYDRPETYLEVGHSGWSDNQYGCNHIWAQDLNTGFKCVPETPETNTHGRANLEANTVLYKGRVDSCKNIASIAAVSACHRLRLQENPRYEKVCAKQCVSAMDSLKKQFGSKLDIRFM